MNADDSGVTVHLYLWRDFYIIVFKNKHKLYTAFESPLLSPPPPPNSKILGPHLLILHATVSVTGARVEQQRAWEQSFEEQLLAFRIRPCSMGSGNVDERPVLCGENNLDSHSDSSWFEYRQSSIILIEGFVALRSHFIRIPCWKFLSTRPHEKQ
jgi:hypothetical protein